MLDKKSEVNISLSLQIFLPQVIYGGAHLDDI